MKKLLLILGVFISVFLLSGCSNKQYVVASRTSLPKLDMNQSMLYENKYLNEYKKLQKSSKNNMVIKWIQAVNKKVPCKLFVGVDSRNDRTKDSEYKIYWDGKCKNGYAYGLGREFERGTLTNMNAIAIYSGKKEEPKYFRYKYNLQNVLVEGDLSASYFVKRTIIDNAQKFDVIYEYGYFGIPSLYVYTSVFNDNIVYFKYYPNFEYLIGYFGNNEFDDRTFQFDLLKNGKKNGYEFIIQKNNTIYAGLMRNNNFIKRVKLPNQYFVHINDILDEIKEAGQKAIQSQQKAQIVIKQYKLRICKKRVKVKFINNDEYKEICYEDEYNRKLQKRIDEKLEKINRVKTQKRQQIQQQRIQQMRMTQQIQAQIRAQQKAAAASAQQVIQNINNFANQLRENNQRERLFNNINFWLMTH